VLGNPLVFLGYNTLFVVVGLTGMASLEFTLECTLEAREKALNLLLEFFSVEKV